MPSSFSAILVYMVKLKDVNSNLIKYVSKIAKNIQEVYFINSLENIDENGIRKNSFYDVFPNQRTKEEMQEYKRLVGMPLIENYDELIDSLE